ncbi:MAG: ABC transporter ATP-binding protein [Candidatus Heimdallarchaeota archaeon]|nr:ABC transporter ATP-binding protein [Candidatus Heimdallarchaeota archaeon]MCG3252566.1 ABC transporter ATP-binding protein [Candidatus Heimdallarchaeota archaeon]MCK4289704.1 ABC transporter ATP-binding protein [Candidatus Heimdallarchaeota archaeon]
MATKEVKNVTIEYNDHKPQVLATEKYKSANQWFWSGLVRYPGLMFTSMFIIILNAVISVLPGILLGLALDILSTGDDYFKTVVISIVVAALMGWLTSSLSAYLWSLASYRFERDIRQEFFDVVQNHSMAFHDEHDSGVLLSMGMNETNQIRFSFTPSLRHLLNSFLSIIIVSIYFFVRIPVGSKVIGVADWRIGIGIVFSFIIYLILAWIYARRIGPIRKELATELGNVSSSSQETFRGIEVVRSFDSEIIEEKKFEKQSLRLADKIKKEGFLSAFYWPALIMVIATAVVFGIGLWMVSKNDGSMSIGQMTSMLSLLLQLVILNFMVPMRLLGLQAGRMNAKRIWDVMTFADPLVEPTKSPEADWSSDLIFDDVTFSYPGKKRTVLENISFKIPAGSRVALLGGPGSGKSTILKLLLRLYDPDKGSIRLNDVGFEEMHTFDVRKDVTLVEQDIFLFGTSFRENISFSKSDATLEEIRTAAKRAQIAKFIESTPDGYETLIGERGVDLSGGQRQRVAIARALLADPKLLLLDDSTSAVDIKTEVRLRLAMEELIKGRTSIVVTQRLSTLVDSDLIIFLDKGKIIDIGSHDELLRRCEEYQFMISLLPVGSQLIEDALKHNKNNGGTN